MVDFFRRRWPASPGLVLFLNAGDPPLPELAAVLRTLDDCGVDCVELAVPFPDSVTDGPIIRRSARRALAEGVELDDVLGLIDSVRPELARLRVVLLADWSHTVKPRSLPGFLRSVADTGVDGLLVHALPPRTRRSYHELADDLGVAVVTSCYAGSSPEVIAEAAANASAYVYLVAHYGKTGTAPAEGYRRLSGALAALRHATSAPVAVGFGIRSRDDVAQVHQLGADAVVVGTAAVARVEAALAADRPVADELRHLVNSLRPSPDPTAPSVHLGGVIQ